MIEHVLVYVGVMLALSGGGGPHMPREIAIVISHGHCVALNIEQKQRVSKIHDFDRKSSTLPEREGQIEN